MTTHALSHRPVARAHAFSAAAFWRLTVDHYLLLPFGGLIALIWANTRPESYFTFAHALSFPVNEVGMALFFALMTQEVVEATMPGGALHTWRKWTLPVVAACGAVLGSALTYLAYVNLKHEVILAPGWPAAVAIDLALAYFIVKLIFRRHPAIPFLVVLAVAADVVGMVALGSRAVFMEIRPGGAALMVAAIGLAFLLRRWKVRSFWPFLFVCGTLSWWALYLDGLHPALALVPIVPFMPHAPRSLELFEDAPHGAHDSSRHFEHVWGHPIQAVLFLFGLANTGVLLSGYGTGTWALLTAALIGKPLGMLAAVGLAVAFGLHLPARLHWRDLVIVAVATSGVFTFGLFFATGVFPLGPILAELKIGAVATGIGVPLAFGLAWLLRAGRFAHHGHPPHHEHAAGHAHARIAIMFVLALFGSCGIASAQHGAPPDDDLRQSIAGQLADKGIDDIDVSVTRGVATLRGRVRTLWLKDWAVEHALDVDGVTAVLTELTIPRAESDERLAEQVSERLQRYVFFSIFDDAEVEVDDGIVTLTGRVTMPQKADAMADLAARVAGVQQIRNGIRTLPASQSDDRLRYIIARQIYGDPVFSQYAILIDPPVHIIVEHGAVTLTGIVGSEVERRIAEVIARMALGVMSVTNELRLADED